MTRGISYNNNRGKAIDALLANSPNLTLLNDRNFPTHFNISTGTFSTIDLTLCTSSLHLNLSCKVYSHLCGKDHFPILISLATNHDPLCTPATKWILSKANWPLFTEPTADLHSISLTDSIETDIASFTRYIIETALKSIPTAVQSELQPLIGPSVVTRTQTGPRTA